MKQKLAVKNHGAIGWFITFIVIFLFDYWAIANKKQTMSQAFKKALYLRPTFLPVLVGWLLLTWHLVHPNRMRGTDVFSIVFDKKKEYK
jgi:small-conductance mechanosensitive channel